MARSPGLQTKPLFRALCLRARRLRARCLKGAELLPAALVLILAARGSVAQVPAPADEDLDPANEVALPVDTALDATTTGETIEDVLGERASPLDKVDISIADAEYEAAQAFLESYIRAIESAHHRYHGDLVRPLTQLGDIEMSRGNYPDAVEHYGRAVHVNRVSSGLHTPDQVPLVYKEAAAQRALGNLTEANNREEYAFEVLQRVYGTYSEDILPGVYRLADWYGANFNIFSARHLYEQAFIIHERNGQQDSPDAIRALEGIATSYRLERFPPVFISSSDETISNPAVTASDRASIQRQQLNINNFPAGEKALQHIVRIRQSDPDSSPMELIEAILELADWHLLFEHYRHAYPLYAHAYQEIDKLGGDAAAYFGEPQLLHYPQPPAPSAPPVHLRADEQPGHVALVFRITKAGRVEDMETSESEPDGLMDLKVRKAVKIARYRPVFVAGDPVDVERFEFRHDFRYFPRNDAPEPPPPDEAGELAGAGGPPVDG